MRLVQTCDACPEQYDVFEGDELVGYLRLRHGHFRAHYGGYDGVVVYEAYPRGDGIFEPGERDYHLEKAKAALLAQHRLERGVQHE
jgi:hypothetical protein